MKRFKVLGSEPAFYVGTIEAFLSMLLALHVLGLTDTSVAWIMAVVTSAGGLATAFMTKHGQLSALIGFAKAALALAIGYGLPLDTTATAAIISFVTVVAGAFLRTQTSSVPTLLTHASPGHVVGEHERIAA